MSNAAPTLLVVDDHPMALSGTTAFLAEVMPDVAVHAAGSAKEALHSLNQGLRPDIVLLDMAKRERITAERLHSIGNATPFEGFETIGAPVRTIVRGKTVALDGKPVGVPGWGRNVAGR